MVPQKSSGISRRDFIKLTGIGALGAGAASTGPFSLFPQRANSQREKLKILQWKHPVPAYDEWFDGVLAKQWGEKSDTEVIVDHVPGEEINERAAAEVAAQRGHDLVMFLSPPATYEKHVIDHKEVYIEAKSKHLEIIELAQKSTFNPKTSKYFAFSDCYMPAVANWFFDPWKRIGFPGGPADYDGLRSGAKQIRRRFGIPCGLDLSRNLAGNAAARAILWSFGGAVQDEDGHVTINSRETIEALKYVKALYQESERPDVFTWAPDSNVRTMLDQKISFTMNAIFLTRQAEREKPQIIKHILVSPAMKGRLFWLACPHVTSCYVIWNFAENKVGAKQFLLNLIDNYTDAFKASELCNLPCFPSVAPDLLVQLSNDPKAEPPYKYVALEDTLQWTRNIGFPGHCTAPIAEIFNASVIPRMFAQVATGALSLQQAAKAAEHQIKLIFEKWNRE